MSERFSDRIGTTQPRRQLQIDEADRWLRNALWNWVCWAVSTDVQWEALASGGMWDEFFHRTHDEMPDAELVRDEVKEWWEGVEWYDIYNLVEYLLRNAARLRGYGYPGNELEARLNHYLTREMSGYRAINGRLVPVTSEVEVAEIERAASEVAGFEGVSKHIDTALALLALKPEPDLRNSIKESISAVEAAVKLLSGEKSGGIDTAVRLLEANVGLHPALKVAIKKLYGYTCEGPGIRHALLESEDISFAEAKFMLVACSAFANFLIDSLRSTAP